MKELKLFALIILLSVYLLSFGQNKISLRDTLADKQLIELFYYMKNEENSYMNKPVVRSQVFLNNFNTIVILTKNQGFPSLKKDYRSKRKRDCIYFFSSVNFLHVLQTKPEVLLNVEIINLFKSEIDLGRLDRKIVSFSFRAIHKLISLGHASLNKENLEMLKFASIEWGIDRMEMN